MTILLPILAVDWSALGQASAAALVSGLGVAFFFSLAIFGAARSSEARRQGQPGVAVLSIAVMFLGLAASLAAVSAAIWLMLEG